MSIGRHGSAGGSDGPNRANDNKNDFDALMFRLRRRTTMLERNDAPRVTNPSWLTLHGLV